MAPHDASGPCDARPPVSSRNPLMVASLPAHSPLNALSVVHPSGKALSWLWWREE